MERKEVDRLITRLNKLSDNPIKNLNKMREIARILVDFYMPNKKENEWVSETKRWK